MTEGREIVEDWGPNSGYSNVNGDQYIIDIPAQGEVVYIARGVSTFAGADGKPTQTQGR